MMVSVLKLRIPPAEANAAFPVIVLLLSVRLPLLVMPAPSSALPFVIVYLI
jgi:hypothetical protein